MYMKRFCIVVSQSEAYFYGIGFVLGVRLILFFLTFLCFIQVVRWRHVFFLFVTVSGVIHVYEKSLCCSVVV